MTDADYSHDDLPEEGGLPLFGDDEQALAPEDLEGVLLPDVED